jgi:hypothetical protein
MLLQDLMSQHVTSIKIQVVWDLTLTDWMGVTS